MKLESCQKAFLACTLAGVMLVSLSGTGEARHHRANTPAVASEVQTVNDTSNIVIMQPGVKNTRHINKPGVDTNLSDIEQPMAEQGTPDLRTRLQKILHPEEDTTSVSHRVVPTTVSAYDDAITGTALASQEQCVRYLLSINPNPRISVSPQQLVSYYYEEGAREGIRPDVAFAQALKETGFFRYGGTVTPDQNNYCGLGTTSATVKGAYFPSARLGVRAHIQHLLAYSSTSRPTETVVDPRYDLVRSSYGTRTLGNWEDLNGRWAVPGNSYGQSILSMFRAMLRE